MLRAGFLLVLIFIYSSLDAKETIFLIRHGETDWNIEKRIQGHTNNPLNNTGIQQAKVIADQLSSQHPEISAIYSSDLCRAYATAQETAKKLNLMVVMRPALREINTGVSEGMQTSEKVVLYKEKWDELDRQYPERKDRWNHSPIPGEETLNELALRIKEEVIQIAKAHPDAKIAIFSHRKAIQAFVADLEDTNLEEIDIPNCGMVEILHDPQDSLHPFRRIN